jgi:hypothetical protein
MNLRLILLFTAFLSISSKVTAQASVIKFSVPKATDNSQWENAPAGSTWSCYNKTVKLRVNLSRTGGDGYAGKKILVNTKILHPQTQVELKNKMDVFTISSKNEGKFLEYFIIDYSFDGTSGLPGNIPSCMLKVEVRIDDVTLSTVTKKYKYE